MTPYFKKIKLRFSNDFHGTATTAWGFRRAGSDAIYITARQGRRIEKDLCGMDGCTCGDAAGCRPGQVYDFWNHDWWEVTGPEIIKVMPGYYKWKYPDNTGRLLKAED